MKPKPVAATILPWLKANLGTRCLAPLTSTDAKALLASVQLVDLIGHADSHRRPPLLAAYRAIVSNIQPHCQHLAFHGIAHVLDWSHRREIWIDSGLAGLDCANIPTSRCQFE